jgi:hypothetical protein
MDELIKRLRLQADVEKFYSGEPMLYDQAANAIEELSVVVRAQKAVLDKSPRWIPVTERLPKRNGEYLVSGKDKVWVCEFMIFGDVGGWCNSAMNPCVKYWMPLPEPPKEE